VLWNYRKAKSFSLETKFSMPRSRVAVKAQQYEIDKIDFFKIRMRVGWKSKILLVRGRRKGLIFT